MYKALLSTLFLGLFPAGAPVASDADVLATLSIAPPSMQMQVEEHVSASGVLIVDVDSGQRIFERSANVQRPMASLTKLMTALVIVENHDLSEIVKVPTAAAEVPGHKAYIEPGEHFTVGSLLTALLAGSANDAALTLANFHSGSPAAFRRAMNARALTLGMTGTSFRNPTGLDDPAHWSTPEDIAALSQYVAGIPEISDRMSLRGKRILSKEGTEVEVYHTHALLHEVSPVSGGKTGTTSRAGECLMSLVASEDHSYVVVLLGSSDRYKDMEVLLDALDLKTPEIALQNE